MQGFVLCITLWARLSFLEKAVTSQQRTFSLVLKHVNDTCLRVGLNIRYMWGHPGHAKSFRGPLTAIPAI